MNNGLTSPSNTEYIFGDKQFLGYVKFFSDDQNFGYLSSNNYGMNINRKFWYKNQDFYIDRQSFDGSVKFKQLVVFRPAYVNNKIKAINIVQYQVDKHRDIAINTILSNNIIHLEDNKRMKLTDGHKGFIYDILTVKRDINIFPLSDIKTYELVEKCCDIYKNDGGVALLLKLDNFMEAIGGDELYYHKLKTDYPDKDWEIDEINKLLSLVDSLTRQKIFKKYVSFSSLNG